MRSIFWVLKSIKNYEIYLEIYEHTHIQYIHIYRIFSFGNALIDVLKNLTKLKNKIYMLRLFVECPRYVENQRRSLLV